jgi:hypothetical protein
MTRKQQSATRFAIEELKGAKNDLQAAIAELDSVRSTDPTIPQIHSLSLQTQQVIDVLNARLRRGTLPS